MTRRTLTLLIAAVALAAGCLEGPAGGRDPAPGVTEHPTEPDMPEPTDVDAACATLSVTADPTAFRPGEGVTITAALTNGCDEAITVQGSSGSCTPRAMEAGVVIEGEPWRFVRNADAAMDMPGCTDDMPPAFTLDPGATLTDAWSWNGTLIRNDCGPDHCSERFVAEPGAYALEAWLVPERHGVRGVGNVTVLAQA